MSRLERMTKLGADSNNKQTMGTESRITAADAGGSPERGARWVKVGLKGVAQVPGSAAECSGSSGPAAARAAE